MYIYRLYNENNVCYIGSTNNVKRRLAEHRSDSKLNNNRSSQKVFETGNKVKIEVLEIASFKKRFEREQFWMNQYKESIVNRAKAGLGPVGYSFISEEQRKQKSLKFKNAWKNNREHVLKYVNAHKTKEFQSMASKQALKARYEKAPTYNVFCSKTRKYLGSFKTNKELGKIINRKQKTTYLTFHGKESNLGFKKYCFSEVIA